MLATQSGVLWRMRLASQRQAYECNWWSTSSDLRQPVTGWRPLTGESVCYCRAQHYITPKRAIKQHQWTHSKPHRNVCVLHSQFPDQSRDRRSNCQLHLLNCTDSITESTDRTFIQNGIMTVQAYRLTVHMTVLKVITWDSTNSTCVSTDSTCDSTNLQYM